MKDDQNWNLAVKGKFGIVEDELEKLRSKIHLYKGSVLKEHIYSVEELLNSRHQKKIETLCEWIRGYVYDLCLRGELPEAALDDYQRRRNRVQRKLRLIEKEICDRDPFLWERVKSMFFGLKETIIQLLPTATKILRLANSDATALLPAP